MNTNSIRNPFRYLSDDFVQKSIELSGLDPALEATKSTAIEGSVGIFNPEESRDIPISLKYPEIKFSQVFSQERLGAGVTKGLAGVISILVECAKLKNSVTDLTNKQNEFIEKADSIAEQVFKRLTNGDNKMQDVRDLSRALDNFGGSYQTTELKISDLNESEIQELKMQVPSTYTLEVDKKSGHLVGVSSVNVAEKMWSVKPVLDFMESGLNADGKLKLMRPYSESFVVVAYKHELKNVDLACEIIEQMKTIESSPETIYKVPVRGDNRFEEVMAVKLSSEAINKIRALLDLKPLPTELPPRFTFGAVPTLPTEINSLDEYMNVPGIEKYRDIVSAQVEAHIKRNQFI